MKSKILDFIFGYEESERAFEESILARAEKRFSDKVVSGLGSAYAKKILSHPAVAFVIKIRNALAYASVRSYGILLLAFGLFTLLGNFAVYYFASPSDIPSANLTVGIVFSVVALPLLLVNAPLNDFVNRYAFAEFLFFDFLCIKKINEVNRIKDREIPVIIPVFIAAALAALGFLFSPIAVFAAVLIAVFITLALSSPEFSLLSTLMLLPILPLLPKTTLIITLLVAVTAVSFLIKVLLGKRLFHFEQYDAVMLIFMLFTLVSGVFNKGLVSFENSLVTVVLSLTYFLVSNILVNRRLAENAVKIIALSSAPVAIYGIIDYYISEARPEWTDPVFTAIKARAASTFGNPNVYAVYLVVAVIFSIALALDRSHGRIAILYTVISALNVYALIITWTRGAWLAILLAAIGFAIIRSRRCPKLILLPLILVPLAIPFIPSGIIERFLSIFSITDSSAITRLSVWRSSVLMFFDNLFIGIGVGRDAFAEEFLKYAEESVTAEHSHNLFLEIGCELGVFALLTFVFLMLIRIRHRATYAKYVRGSSVDNLCTVSGTALLALLTFGMTDYIWYSSTMLVLFWAVFGIGSATLRISKKEYDDSLVATPTEMEDHSAEINIIIIESGKNKNV